MSALIIEGNQNDIVNVLAVMLFPDDEELRKQYIALDSTSRMLLDDSDANLVGMPDRTSIKSLMNAPSFDDMQNIIIPKHTKNAMLAGDMLAAQYLMHYHTSAVPSLNKAKFMVQENQKITENSAGYKLSLTKRTADKHWNKFKPVSPLWAAYNLNTEFPFHEDENIFQPNVFPIFLEIAAHIQDFATANISEGNNLNKPIIELDEIWALPSHIPRRQLITNANLLRLRENLKKYKAPV